MVTNPEETVSFNKFTLTDETCEDTVWTYTNTMTKFDGTALTPSIVTTE
jgi:hypothetical protein